MKRFYDLPHHPSRGHSLGGWVAGVVGTAIFIGLLIGIPRIVEWRSARLFAQAQELANAGEPLAAARKAEAAYRLFPYNPTPLSFAIAAQAQPDPTTAQRLTRELLANPRATPGNFQTVLAAFGHQPIEEYAVWIQTFPDSVLANSGLLPQLSRQWEKAGDLPQAIEYARRAVEADPQPANALRLGLLLARDPATQAESLPWLKRAIESGEAEIAFPALEALSALPPKKITAASIPDPDDLRKKFPEANPNQLFAIFRIDWQQYPEKRAERLDQLAEWQRRLPRLELARWLTAQEDPERLIEWITPKEAQADPAVFELYAQALLATGREDELLALLPETFSLSSPLATALLEHLRKEKQTTPLLQLASRLHAQSPENRDYLQLAAYLHFLNGEVKEPLLEAVAARAQAEPDYRPLRTTLALGYLQRGDAARALEILSPDLKAPANLSEPERVIVARTLSRNGKSRESRAWLTGIQADSLLPEERKFLTSP